MSHNVPLLAAVAAALALLSLTAVSAQAPATGTCQISADKLEQVVFPANLPCGDTPINCSACLCALARPLVPLFGDGTLPASQQGITNIIQGCEVALFTKLSSSAVISNDALAQVASCDTNILVAESDTCFADLQIATNIAADSAPPSAAPATTTTPSPVSAAATTSATNTPPPSNATAATNRTTNTDPPVNATNATAATNSSATAANATSVKNITESAGPSESSSSVTTPKPPKSGIANGPNGLFGGLEAPAAASQPLSASPQKQGNSSPRGCMLSGSVFGLLIAVALACMSG